MKSCGRSPLWSDASNAQCKNAEEQHLLALFGNKLQLKGGDRNQKKRSVKGSSESKTWWYPQALSGQEELIQGCSGETRNKREMREKTPGVLALKEEAVRDSPKAFLPADLVPVSDCHHPGAPTAGKLTSSI